MSKKIFLSVFITLILAFVVIYLIFRTPSHDSNKPPNIVLIIMDTARQDHCSLYNYGRKTTPILEKLSKSSTVYNNAYSPGGWTSPAHASLFTGLFPISHGVNQGQWILPDDSTTLAEILSDHDYETIGIIENPVLSIPNNFQQGFHQYYETWKIEEEFSTNKTTGVFKKFITSRDKQKPFFVFFNFIYPHTPYNSSGPFYDSFLSDPSMNLEHNMWVDYFLDKTNFSESEINHLLELYDAEILYTDYLIGQIIDELQNSDLWNETVFIVTSDHGENIDDHNMMDHVFSLHESIIKIPLIIYYPQSFPANTSDNEPTLLLDIFPTLLNLCGIDKSEFHYHGMDLIKDNRKGRRIFAEYYYPTQALTCFPEEETDKLEPYKRSIKAVIDGHFKLIWGSDGNHELFDLSKDPGEKNNLINNKNFKEKKYSLMKDLKEFIESHHKAEVQTTKDSLEKMDPKTKEALRSLGYIK